MINLNSFNDNISPYCLLDIQNYSQLIDNYCQTLHEVKGRQEIYLLNLKWQSLGIKYFTLSNFSHWEWYRVAACDVRGSRLKTPGLTSWLYQDHLILESLILLRGGGLRGNTRRIHSCLLTFRWMIEDLLCCWRRALLIKSLTSSIWLREFCMKWFCSLFEGFKGFHF